MGGWEIGRVNQESEGGTQAHSLPGVLAEDMACGQAGCFHLSRRLRQGGEEKRGN